MAILTSFYTRLWHNPLSVSAILLKYIFHGNCNIIKLHYAPLFYHYATDNDTFFTQEISCVSMRSAHERTRSLISFLLLLCFFICIRDLDCILLLLVLFPVCWPKTLYFRGLSIGFLAFSFFMLGEKPAHAATPNLEDQVIFVLVFLPLAFGKLMPVSKAAVPVGPREK